MDCIYSHLNMWCFICLSINCAVIFTPGNRNMLVYTFGFIRTEATLVLLFPYHARLRTICNPMSIPLTWWSWYKLPFLALRLPSKLHILWRGAFRNDEGNLWKEKTLLGRLWMCFVCISHLLGTPRVVNWMDVCWVIALRLVSVACLGV